MSKTTTAVISIAFASQLVCACASPQWVSYQLSDSAQRHHGDPDYLQKIVVKTKGKQQSENKYLDIRYY